MKKFNYTDRFGDSIQIINFLDVEEQTVDIFCHAPVFKGAGTVISLTREAATELAVTLLQWVRETQKAADQEPDCLLDNERCELNS